MKHNSIFYSEFIPKIKKTYSTFNLWVKAFSLLAFEDKAKRNAGTRARPSALIMWSKRLTLK